MTGTDADVHAIATIRQELDSGDEESDDDNG